MGNINNELNIIHVLIIRVTKPDPKHINEIIQEFKRTLTRFEPSSLQLKASALTIVPSLTKASRDKYIHTLSEYLLLKSSSKSVCIKFSHSIFLKQTLNSIAD